MFYDLVLDGPGKNALGTPMMESILARLDEAGGQAVRFSGAGDVLSAGLDLKEIASLDAAGIARFVALVETLMARIFDYPGPTVACVNGHAIAGGCVITLCCDLRVATRDPRARIGLNETAIGLVFPPKILRIVTHRIPPRSRHEVLLRGALHAPEDALRLGLVDELADDPRAVSDARVRELAALPRAAYLATKNALRAGVTAFQPSEYDAALRATLPVWASDAIKERVMARLKK
ncbi:MAG TPA: enoyl-CoA hydratase/isomerase family protein [Polyangiaceae bacterium]|jgi:enoyl-CoA hydratase/carnithine racemase